MKQHILLLLTAITLCISPYISQAQEFSLEEGDGFEAQLPKDAANVSTPAPEIGSAINLAAPATVKIGEPFAARLTSDRPLSIVSMHWGGKTVQPSISVWNDRHVALALFGTDVLTAKSGKEELVVTATIDGNESTFRRTIVVQSKKYETQELTLPEKMVTPPKEVLDRITAERAVITKARNTISPTRMWTLPFQRPTTGSLSSTYGLQRILNGKPKNPHRGLDFRAPMNTPIKSVADGIVILVADHYYAGRSVYVDHGNGIISLYFHLEKPLVQEGAAVERGEVVGLSGMTGRVTGPHLHFSLAVLGKLVDPESLFVDKVDALLR